jgi:hypothetical protein
MIANNSPIPPPEKTHNWASYGRNHTTFFSIKKTQDGLSYGKNFPQKNPVAGLVREIFQIKKPQSRLTRVPGCGVGCCV